ncbi:hypothetical protein NPIL_307321 [Nephila pilipes]|uniref:Uncharacterized protein n=1 Tax=Nephila pilipes TaxID=299642 RepID=A0A8X6IZH7_NEPPI|nr:hypothetical protein NPIL_307321 [Nephila pilipes]
MKRTSLNDSNMSNKRLKRSRLRSKKHINTESSGQELVISNHQYPVSSSNGNRNLRRMSSDQAEAHAIHQILNTQWTENHTTITKRKLTDFDDDHQRLISELRASYGMPPLNLKIQNASSVSDDESKNVDKKIVQRQLSYVNKLQKVPVVTSSAPLPKLIIGETLKGCQKFNVLKGSDTLVQVNSNLNVSQKALSNMKIVKVSPTCMKKLKESLLKNSPAADSQHVCVVVPPKALNRLKLLPTKGELQKLESVTNNSTETNLERKKPSINKLNVEKILENDRIRRNEKETMKKKEKIIMKMVAKFEEKEEKKLMKFLEKIKASLIAKKQGQLNEKEKKFVATVENKNKLLEVIKYLKCKDQNDARRLLKYFGV